MPRRKISEEIYNQRILSSLTREPQPAYRIAEKANISIRQFNLLINSLIDKGLIVKRPVQVTKFMYQLK